MSSSSRKPRAPIPSLPPPCRPCSTGCCPPLSRGDNSARRLQDLLTENGFDSAQHEQIRADLRNGRIGLAMNPASPQQRIIEDVTPSELFDPTQAPARLLRRGRSRLAPRGSRPWSAITAGARQSLDPGCRRRERTSIPSPNSRRTPPQFPSEVQLAKTRRASRDFGTTVPHIFTTSHLTHAPIQNILQTLAGDSLRRDVWLSPGRSIGLRMVPTVRDLRFAWEETAQQRLDEQKEKMRDSVRAALTNWARSGEATDYTDNLPEQCLHPVGHWFEVPNLLKNGVLARLLAARPQLRTLVTHNIDTLGVTPDPVMLGWFQKSGATLGFEVISRRIEDHGGGLARVNGRMRIVEGLALSREEDEFALSYYNSNTCWIDIDRLLALFNLTREDLANPEKTAAAVRTLAARTAHLRHAEGRKKTLGQRPGGYFPRGPIRKTLGRHDRVARMPDRVCARAPVAWPATQGPGATRQLAARRFRRRHRSALLFRVIPIAQSFSPFSCGLRACLATWRDERATYPQCKSKGRLV